MAKREPFPLVGPAGALEAVLDRPDDEPGLRAVVSHPHPLYGGTMDNAVVALATRALVEAGAETLRFNFRGVGRSDGEHDGGKGERLDLEAAIAAFGARQPVLPLLLCGYSFGAVMTLEHLARRASDRGPSPSREPAGVLLIAPPVSRAEGGAGGLGDIPTVVVYGELDALTPLAPLEELAARWGRKVRLEAIPGVGHDLGSSSAPHVLGATLRAAVATLAAAARKA